MYFLVKMLGKNENPNRWLFLSLIWINYILTDFEYIQITLDFSFKQSAGWWTAVGVEVKRGSAISGLNLQAPALPDAPSAVLGKAYHCSLPLVYASEEASLTFPNIQVTIINSLIKLTNKLIQQKEHNIIDILLTNI